MDDNNMGLESTDIAFIASGDRKLSQPFPPALLEIWSAKWKVGLSDVNSSVIT